MEVKIYLLRQPSIQIDGQDALTRLSSKSMAMIYYLAARQGQTVSREMLSEIFWPEQSEENARSNLRQNLSFIRKMCQEEFTETVDCEDVSLITSVRSVCGLNEELDVFVDAVQFRNCIKNAERSESDEERIQLLQDAVNLYEGEFLSGVTVRGSAAFEDWILMERESINHMLTESCKKLAQLYSEKRHYEDAITCLKKLLQMDPLLEEVHLELMKLYYDNKERAKAVHQYKECVRILGEELNIGPMEETRSFYKHISGDEVKQTVKKVSCKSILKLSMGPVDDTCIDYEGIYNLLEPVIDEGMRVPDYLKRGLAILFPEFSDKLDCQNLPEIYLYYTVNKLLEELAKDHDVMVSIPELTRLDEKSRRLVKYMKGHLNHTGVQLILLEEE